MENFDIVSSAENILSGALGKVLLNIAITIMVFIIITWIIVAIAKSLISDFKEKIAARAQAAREDARLIERFKQAEEAQERVTQHQADVRKRLKSERMKRNNEKNISRLHGTSSSDRWVDRVVNKIEDVSKLKERGGLAKVAKEKKEVYSFILDSIVSSEGEKVILGVDASSGKLPPLGQESFNYITGVMLSAEDKNYLQTHNSVRGTKNIVGNKINYVVNIELQTIELVWNRKEVTVTEKVLVKGVEAEDNFFGTLPDLSIGTLDMSDLDLGKLDFSVDNFDISEDIKALGL